MNFLCSLNATTPLVPSPYFLLEHYSEYFYEYSHSIVLLCNKKNEYFITVKIILDTVDTVDIPSLQ